eukprot:7065197-Alexandrium_andersonii.AAC.1
MVLTRVALAGGAALLAEALEGKGASQPAQEELRAEALSALSAPRVDAPPVEAAAGRRSVRRDGATEEPGVPPK